VESTGVLPIAQSITQESVGFPTIGAVCPESQETSSGDRLSSTTVDPHICTQQPIDEATHPTGLPDDIIRDLDLARFDQLDYCLHLLVYVE
jgi:hypothetical protein